MVEDDIVFEFRFSGNYLSQRSETLDDVTDTVLLRTKRILKMKNCQRGPTYLHFMDS